MPRISRTPEEVHAAIQRFLASSKAPALLEPGEPQIALTADNHAIELRQGRLVVQAWDDRRNFTRKITGIADERPGRLELIVERFGKQPGTLELLDMARPRGQQASKRGTRLTYRDQFRRSLTRQFPGWAIRDLSTEPDLEHSLSPAYARGFLVKGATSVAAIGAPPGSDAGGALTFGLIWLSYLRERERRPGIDTLAVFVPTGDERSTALRVLHLDRQKADYRVFAYDETYEAQIELNDYGNIDTRVAPRRGHLDTRADDLLTRLAGLTEIEIVENNDESRSVRVRGLEIARERSGELEYGVETRHRASESNVGELAALAREVARVRTAAADRRHELYQRNPELWLESSVRSAIEEIDASLLPKPIYGQVPALAGSDRGIIDLLGIDLRGRLAVVELKAGEDPQLPIQALDYWIRVEWHRQHDDFARNGYFPGISIADVPPRMLLVAPALEFHPTTEKILDFFSPAIEVERIGVGMDWRRELKVVFRMKGARTQ